VIDSDVLVCLSEGRRRQMKAKGLRVPPRQKVEHDVSTEAAAA